MQTDFNELLGTAISNFIKLTQDPITFDKFEAEINESLETGLRILQEYKEAEGTIKDADTDSLGHILLKLIVSALPPGDLMLATKITVYVKLVTHAIAWHARRKAINKQLASAVLLGQPLTEDKGDPNEDSPDTTG